MQARRLYDFPCTWAVAVPIRPCQRERKREREREREREHERERESASARETHSTSFRNYVNISTSFIVSTSVYGIDVIECTSIP